ncbi:beta-N-acetylhexosaminidase [Ginsengibacter hankyongi]|uniref:beta-N-acetylhexosaminidase n=1 Tax=Ginsengibacter hankyongi TaxID=2607284 RepID=A0A5J5ID79_9BACT|nr:beta-N-acetylhexosaminidase [Ginsengibacter hankyongi]KAA9036112.1 beta-N-acetylhexosaminidase [Ginsengibacter hankyongi]
MKKYLIFYVQLIAAFFYVSSLYAQEISIIPKPVEMTIQTGCFVLSGKTCLVVDNGASKTADYLQSRIREGLGIVLKENSTVDCINKLILKIDKQTDIGKEGYKLLIDDNISIIASDNAGLFYGVQSLLQLMPPQVYGEHTSEIKSLELPKLRINDYPRFQYRGMMVDISRHFVSKKDLLKIIDMMAMHKLNVLHLHLTDDQGWRIEIKSYPKLTSVGSTGDFTNPDGPEKYFLSQDEIREIVAFAAYRHVMVIPEIEMPGHSHAASKAYPDFFDGGNAFNPANSGTFTFIGKIMDEMITLFPAPYFHLGGDEVAGATHWLEMPDVQNFMKARGYKTAGEVEAYFDRKVADMLISRGKQPIGWEEVVNSDVNRKTVIQWWLGHLMPPKNLNKALSNGNPVIMSPNWYVYLDYAQAPGEPGAPWNGNINGPNSLELIYNWEPLPDTLSAGKQVLVLGIEAPLWTEFIKSTSFRDYMIYPRMSALAEINWVPRGSKNLKDFHFRMQKQYMRYKAAGVNYRTPGWIGDIKYLTH